MAVTQSRGVATKQGYLTYYSKRDAIGTKVSVRCRRGHLSGVFTKRGSTVHTRTYGYKVMNRHKRLETRRRPRV